MELKERMKNQERERERENSFIQERMGGENNKFIENKIRRKRVKIKDILINTKLSKSCYIIKNYYILIYYLYNAIG